MKEEKNKNVWSRWFEVAYRDCIDEMTEAEIKKKTKEFKVKMSNTELDEESVNKMMALMEDTKDLEKEIPELYDVCMNHSLKECSWNCKCDYNIIRTLMEQNLTKTLDLVRKANLRHR